MSKTEAEFIRELEGRAREQRRLVETTVLPHFARRMGEWLAVNPWRVLMPLSLIIYGLWRTMYGEIARELVLGLFGGFR